MRILAFILAVFAAGFSMFQSGLGLTLAEKGFDLAWIADFGSMATGTQCLLASAALGILGALFAASKKKIAAWTLIAATGLMIYVEITAPFTYSRVCVLHYALAAMWGSAGSAKPAEEYAVPADSEPAKPELTPIVEEELAAAEEAAEETVAETASESALAEAEAAAEKIAGPSVFVAEAPAAGEAAVSEISELQEELTAAEETAEETAGETSGESALAEADEAAEEIAGPAPAAARKEESPFGTVLVMIVAVVIGAGMMSAYWKNEMEQKSKASLSVDPAYQQMIQDVKAKDALIQKHEEALKEAGAKLQEQMALAAEKEQQIQKLEQHGAELDSQIAGLKADLDGAKAEANSLKEKVASLEKSIAEEAAKKYAFVRGTNVRVRSKPSSAKDSQVVARITNRTVEVLKSERPRGASTSWYYVKGDFGEGWVFGKNVEMQR